MPLLPGVSAMLSALRESPLETVTANLGRPRVWGFPDVRSHGLVVMTTDTLYLTGTAEPPAPALIDALKNGADIESLLGLTAEVVTLDAIRKARHDLVTDSLLLDVEYARGGRKRIAMTFADHTTADACFTKLWRRLGTRVRLVPCKRDLWELARLPVCVLFTILLGTYVLAMAANGVEHVAEARAAGIATGGVATTLESLLGGVSWEVICGIGGVLAALVQVWLYRRVTEPPRELELVRV